MEDEKFIWPLIGVFLGWVLTTLSANFKNRSDRKKLIGNLLTKLIRVQRQLATVILATEKMKDYPSDWTEYESIRKGITNRHFLEPESVREDFKKSIDDIAPFFPVQAIYLEDLYGFILKSKSASMASHSDNKDAYIRMLSMHEVVLDGINKELLKSIITIALKHGLTTYIKVRYVNYVRTRNKKNLDEFTTKFTSDLIDEVNNTHNKSSKTDVDDAVS